MNIRAIMIVFLTVAMAASCGKPTPRSILPDDVVLQPGDVVFRRGGGLSSYAVLMADRHGRYSHVGIVVDSAGTAMIVHAVPGEPDFAGDPDRVKMESPASFFSTIRTSVGEVKRLTCDTAAARRAARFALATYRRGTLFDHDYDDEDSTRMYCCELVERAYRNAGYPLAHAPRHHIRLPGMGAIHCILPSDICNCDSLVSITLF